MSESITELARVEVSAISVPMRADPKQLHTLDKMMLQANGDDTVQVDVFGSDPQGHPLHNSMTMDEQSYEQLRKDLFTQEIATMPPFSSFKSGNTLGRVVGETPTAVVPASQANPPIESDNSAETDTGEKVLDGIQLGLDLIGLVPILGIPADIVNAGISVIRGDYAGAVLSVLGIIPIAGDGLKGGVLIGKSAKKFGAREGKLNQPPPSQNKNGTLIRGGRLEVKCFKVPEGLDENEFLRQLKEQEDAINSISAEKMLERRQAIRDAGGTGPLRDTQAQIAARKDYEKQRVHELARAGIYGEPAEIVVASELKELAATHRLDIIAGGDPSDISGVGDKRTNSSIGSQWKGERSKSLEDHAVIMKKEGREKDKMHVKLKKC